MPDNKISFDVNLNARDIFNFQTQLLLRRSKAIFFIFGFSYLFLIFVLIYSYISVGKIHIVTTIIVVTLPFFMRFLRIRVAKKTLETNPQLQEKQRYTFDNESVTIKGEKNEGRIELAKLKRVSITKKLILLWHTNTTANIIPVRCLSTQQLEQLKEITQPYKKAKN